MRTHFVWRLDELKRWTLNEIKKSLASHTAATLAPSSGTAGMVYFSSEVASETAFGASSAVGTSTKVARADHTHGTPADPGNITSHVAAADPHTVYQLESEKNAASGYAGLDASSMLLSSFMGAGAYSSLTFLRGDRTWSTVSGGAGDVPGFGATVTGETAFDLTSNAGVSTSVSRADHTHGTPATPAGGGTPATGVSPSTAFGQSTSVGVSTNYARQDHVHGTPEAPAGGGAMTLISDNVVGAGGTTGVDISSISTAYKHLRLLYACRGDAAQIAVSFNLKFNGDGSTNYQWLYYYIYGGGNANTVDWDDPSIRLYQIPATSAAAGSVGTGQVEINNYAGNVFWKGVEYHGSFTITSGSNQTQGWHGHGAWRSTASINQITLSASSGNLVEGSRVSLYGIG